MKYSDYTSLKVKMERKAKLLSFVPYMICIGVFFQIAFIISQTEVRYTFLDLTIMDQLFSVAALKLQSGNMVYAFIIYASILFCILYLLIGTYLASKNHSFGYSLLIVAMFIVSVVAVLSLDYVLAFIHFLVIIMLFVGRSNC